MNQENCSDGIRGFAKFIFGCNILIGAILIYTGCGELSSWRGNDVYGTFAVVIGIGTIITGGLVYNLFKGFAQLIDDVRALKDHFMPRKIYEKPDEE